MAAGLTIISTSLSIAAVPSEALAFRASDAAAGACRARNASSRRRGAGPIIRRRDKVEAQPIALAATTIVQSQFGRNQFPFSVNGRWWPWSSSSRMGSFTLESAAPRQWAHERLQLLPLPNGWSRHAPEMLGFLFGPICNLAHGREAHTSNELVQTFAVILALWPMPRSGSTP